MTERHDRFALVTNAAGFAGPPAVDALLGAGFHVLAHDAAFADPATWAAFSAGRTLLEPLAIIEPEEIVAAAFERAGTLQAIVSNDHHPAPTRLPESAPIEELRENYARLVECPFRLAQAALPHLRKQGGANIVLVTSNRTRLPLSGGAFPDAARAAVNAMVRSLAIDCAKDNVVVNAVAPNFLYSEAYYPSTLFRETERGRDYVRRSVPVGRLADPHEIGEVIAFLATVRTRFLTGAIIDFSGGWPFGEARPAV
jgi:NAD(P)-dependent dehydrogenase (short-subunit alcohol dehydrogenase family)